MTRHIILVSHTADATGRFPLNDLAGSAGRWDLLARAIGASFLVSNGIRKDVELQIILTSSGEAERTLVLDGSRLRHLNPDERSTAALMRNALMTAEIPGTPVERSAGVMLLRRNLAEAIGQAPSLVHLHENGKAIRLGPDGEADTWFLLSDQKDLTAAEATTVASHPQVTEASLGPVALHTSQCLTLLHDRLDRGVDSR